MFNEFPCFETVDYSEADMIILVMLLCGIVPLWFCFCLFVSPTNTPINHYL